MEWTLSPRVIVGALVGGRHDLGLRVSERERNSPERGLVAAAWPIYGKRFRMYERRCLSQEQTPGATQTCQFVIRLRILQHLDSRGQDEKGWRMCASAVLGMRSARPRPRAMLAGGIYDAA